MLFPFEEEIVFVSSVEEEKVLVLAFDYPNSLALLMLGHDY
jgi:hypothetical protein